MGMLKMILPTKLAKSEAFLDGTRREYMDRRMKPGMTKIIISNIFEISNITF